MNNSRKAAAVLLCFWVLSFNAYPQQQQKRLPELPPPQWYPSPPAPAGANFFYAAGSGEAETESEAREKARKDALESSFRQHGLMFYGQNGQEIADNRNPRREIEMAAVRKWRGFKAYALFKVKWDDNKFGEPQNEDHGEWKKFDIQAYRDMVLEHNSLMGDRQLEAREQQRKAELEVQEQERQAELTAREQERKERIADLKVQKQERKAELAEQRRREQEIAAEDRNNINWISFGAGTGALPYGDFWYSGAVSGVAGGYVSGRLGKFWGQSYHTYGFGLMLGYGSGSSGASYGGGINLYPFDNFFAQFTFVTSAFSYEAPAVVTNTTWKAPRTVSENGVGVMGGYDLHFWKVFLLSGAVGAMIPLTSDESTEVIGWVAAYSLSLGFKFKIGR